MERLFDAEGTALGVQLAVAEAFLRLGEDYRGGRAARLKERPTCPREVSLLILPRLVT
jgi:hypothetical protein